MALMKCKTCGSTLDQDMKFCGTCGSPVEFSPATGEVSTASVPRIGSSRKYFKNPIGKFVKPAIAAVAIIAIIVIGRSAFKPAQYDQIKSWLQIEQNDDAVVISEDGKHMAKIEGYLSKTYRSLYNNKAVILVSENQDVSFGDDNSALYREDGTLIDEDVYKAYISLSGQGVAFIKNIDHDTYSTTGELYLNAGGKNVSITSDCNISSPYALSPDGKILVYTAVEDDEFVGYYYDGKTHELGEDIMPVAVSNGAKQVYYMKNGILYVQSGTRSDTKVMLGEDFNSIYFNKDFSEVIYSTSADSKSKSYISQNGGSKQSLDGSIDDFLLPDGTMRHVKPIVAVTSFADTFYKADDSIYHITNDFESERVIKAAFNPHLSTDEKTITFQKGDSIYHINGKDNKAQRKVIVDGGIVSLVGTTSDGQGIYFVNEDNELCYQKGHNKPRIITDEFDSTGKGLFKGKIFYFATDGDVYAVANGEKTLIKGIDGYIHSMYGFFANALIITEEDGETLTYSSTDGKTFIPED